MKPARALITVAILFLSVSPASAAGPNILFIAIDDLNDWVSPLAGHPQVKTPHMDRLAARGVVFTNAHCQAPLCNSSRTSVLMGLRPSTSGIYALDPWFRSAPQWKNWITLPQYFSANGYRTYATGKIYHDAYPPKDLRKDGPEFDIFGYHGGAGPLPPKKFVQTPDNIKLMDWGVYPERDEDQEDYKIATWAVDHLKTMPADKPFFLSVGFRRPHVPCYASQKWFDLYPADKLILPPILDDDRNDTPRFSWYLHWKLPEPRLAWLRRSNQLAPFVRAYLACISSTDAQVGRVLDALEASGKMDNTVIVLWSDHGFHLGEKLISGKNTLWERSTRVPLIFAGPGITPKQRCASPAELLDLYPTLIDLCKLPANPALEGHSLLPQLKDATIRRDIPAITTQGPNNHAIRTDRWRYIHYANGTEELYDETSDPNEWKNLAADPAHAATLRQLAQLLPKTNVSPIPGSKIRLIEIKEGQPFWEARPIAPDDAIPD